MLQLQAAGRRGTSSLQLSRLQHAKKRSEIESQRERPREKRERLFFSNKMALRLYISAELRSKTGQQQQPQSSSVAQACPVKVGDMSAPPRPASL
jgi:hypothetical protein